MKKKLSGDVLDEEEEKFLSESRVRKKEEDNVIDDKNVKGKKIEKDNKKGKEEVKNEEKEKTELNFNKKTSQINEHSSLFIKNFLFYVYDKRTITFDHMYAQEDKQLNNTQVRNEKEEKIIRIFEENEKNNIETEEEIEKRKNDLIEDSKKFHEKIIEERKKVNNLEEILKSREEIKGSLLAQIEAEDKLKDLIKEIEESNEESDDKKKKEKFDFNGAYDIL